MGSGKRHKSDKSRDVKKKRHRSRSRSSSTDREKHRHHKKHKKRSRLVDYDSDVEIVSAPPPPKISKSHLSTPPPPDISIVEKEDKHRHSKEERYVKTKDDKYRDDKYKEDDKYREDRYKDDKYRDDKYKQSRDDKYDLSKREKQNHVKEDRSSRQKKSPSPPKGGATVTSLSIEETNRIRAKLGLKPLEVDSGPQEGTDLIKDDLGEFRHKPAINTAEKERTQKIRDKLNTQKQKRQIEAALSSVKTLGESDSDDDASEWIKKSRKIEEEKRKAAERAKLLDQMDQEFGIGELVNQEVRNERRNAYTDKDLRGLKVEHNLDNFEEGKGIILTLKDQTVLDDNADVLVNVNMIDDERYKKNILIRSKQPGYDAFDENVDEFGMPVKKMLEKYDEEIDGEKRDSFAIGFVDPKELRDRKAALVKQKLANKRLETLDLPEPMIAREYFSQEEIAFKKPKKKVRKIRKKVLKADDLIVSNSNDYLRDLGSRRRNKDELRPNDILETDDTEAPPDLSGVKIEEVDRDLDLKIKKKAERLKGPIKSMRPENIANYIKQENDMDTSENKASGNIILNSTAEFCRTLGDIPTYGQAGNREDNHQEFMDFQDEEIKGEYDNPDDEDDEGRGTWNAVETHKTKLEPAILEAAILDAEPTLDQGVAGALKLAMSKGYLQKEDSNRPSASRFAHLRAQNYSIEDKTYGDDDKFSRRDRFNGPTSEFKEKDGFRPNVKLEYIDDDGHLLDKKEAFRYLSHKFHGKGPGKNKIEKRMKKSEQEILMKKMSSIDTPLGTLSLLQAKQKETQSAFVVLSGNKQMQTTSISKSKH